MGHVGLDPIFALPLRFHNLMASRMRCPSRKPKSKIEALKYENLEQGEHGEHAFLRGCM